MVGVPCFEDGGQGLGFDQVISVNAAVQGCQTIDDTIFAYEIVVVG